ncbi:hypothetical protein PENFLA_c006G00409 [Penicillium flavigenum]|uniref:Uncharacterized protein n=1 Tax=Penicillium flavigenum TaxID=254877 RepID=A0A1V6TKL6_9EURO|nr:hypothetical protein PENFLA_c006G00409 [Penicillium flavigenum]
MATAFDDNISVQELADMLQTGVAILNQNDESIMHALRTEFRTRSQIPWWRVLMLSPLDDDDMRRLNLSNGGFICTIADITHEKTAKLLQVEIAREAQERKQL